MIVSYLTLDILSRRIDVKCQIFKVDWLFPSPPITGTGKTYTNRLPDHLAAVKGRAEEAHHQRTQT
jgi:hypothetical protein